MCHCAFMLFQLAACITKYKKEWAWKEEAVSSIVNWHVLMEQEDVSKADHSAWITAIEKRL